MAINLGPVSDLGLRGRDFLALSDFTVEEVGALVDAAAHWKAVRGDPAAGRPLAGKTVAVLLLKPSLRTRVSFDVAVTELGGHALHLPGDGVRLGEREPIADGARVLSEMVHGVVVRGHDHAEIAELADWASVPVINGLTARCHPCQAVADLLTLRERFGGLRGVRLAYIGDGNNVAHSLLAAAARTGLHLTLACPEGYDPDPDLLEDAAAGAAAAGGSIAVVRRPADAVRGADAVYTDVWVSMGQDDETEARRRAFAGYCVDAALMDLAAPHAVFLHDLPAHRGEEVAADVLDGPRSLAFQQAGNRMHASKAILAALLGGA